MIVGRHEVARSTPVHGVQKSEATAFLERLSVEHRTFAGMSGFDGSTGQVVALPDNAGRFAMVLIGLGDDPDPFAVAALNRYTEGTFVLGEGFAEKGDEEESPDERLLKDDELHWIREDLALQIDETMAVKARIRYRQPLEKATLYKTLSG